MSTIKNRQIWLYCHFNKLIKRSQNQFPGYNIEPKTCQKCFSYSTLVSDHFLNSTQGSKEISKSVTSVCSNAYDDVTDFEICGFHKKLKSRYLDNKALFFLQIQKLTNCASRATVQQKIVLQQRQPLRVRLNFLLMQEC